MQSHRTALLLVAFAAFSQAAAAQSPDPLARLQGSWKGEGWARQKTSTAPEMVRCRIENSYYRSSMKLVVEGRCAVPGRRFNLTGSVSRKADGQSYSGRWSNPFGAGAASVTGTQSGKRITLRFSAPHPDTGKKAAHLMQWDIESDGFSLITVLPGEGTTLSELRFSR